MRTRLEPWGAWVRLEAPAALVALDRQGATMLGLDGGELWRADAPSPSAPIEAHVAVTSQCGAGCEGCYLDARPDGAHVPREALERTLDELRAEGVFTVAFGGGEPLLRDDLGELARAARDRGLLPVVTTSGIGLTERRAASLRSFAQVNVSYDGEEDVYADVRGFPGAHAAERAMRMLHDAGVPFGVNVVLTRSSFDALEPTLLRARSLGAREAQLLRYKPAGRAARLDYLARRLSRDQVARLGPTLRDFVRDHGSPSFRVRIDCAMVALLSVDGELYARADELRTLGVFGCEAGASLCAVRTDGQRAPCSFLPPGSVAPHGQKAPCSTCAFRDVCRGGCKAVSRYLEEGDGPDPECPRVVAYREKVSA